MVKEMHLQENKFFDVDPKVGLGDKVTRNVAQYPPHHVALCTSLKLLHPKVKEKMHFQENTLFDLDLGVKKRDGQTDGQKDGQTTNQNRYEINIPFFLKIKHV